MSNSDINTNSRLKRQHKRPQQGRIKDKKIEWEGHKKKRDSKKKRFEGEGQGK